MLSALAVKLAARVSHGMPQPQDSQPSPEQRAAAGRAVAEFMESPAFEVVRSAIRGQQDVATRTLMGMQPTNEGATYAAHIGRANGLADIERVLNSIVNNGKQAEAEIREAEEAGS